MLPRLVSLMAVLLALALPVAAQQGDVVPATGEILPGWQNRDGTRVAAIRIRLAPGWKTYWRSPGDAGIPPAFDWSGSRNLEGLAMTWPTPRVIPQGGMRTIGYENDVILPVTITPRDPARPVTLRADLDIGVCRDICVPYQLSLGATLDGTGQQPTPAIAAALAARPYSAAEAGLGRVTCALRPGEDGVEIETTLEMRPLGPQEVVVIEPGQPGFWASEATTDRRGGTLTARADLVPSGGALAVDRSAVVITVLAAGRSVEVTGCTPG